MITGEEADEIIILRKKNYGMLARLTGIFTSQKGNLVVYSIELIDKNFLNKLNFF